MELPGRLMERVSRPRMLVVGAALSALSGIAATTGSDAESHRLAASFAAALPLGPLLIGYWMLRPLASSPGSMGSTQHGGRAGLALLLGVPSGLALAAFLRPAAPLDPIVAVVTALLFAAYLILAARALGEAEAPPAEVLSQTPPSEPVPPRLRRRLRLYRWLQLAAALSFAVPILVATSQIGAGSTPQPLLLFSVAGLLGTLACRAFFIDTLERHLQRDPALVRDLTRLRRHARRGRPAPMFYVAALCALVAMALFASRQLLGLTTPGSGI